MILGSFQLSRHGSTPLPLGGATLKVGLLALLLASIWLPCAFAISEGGGATDNILNSFPPLPRPNNAAEEHIPPSGTPLSEQTSSSSIMAIDDQTPGHASDSSTGSSLASNPTASSLPVSSNISMANMGHGNGLSLSGGQAQSGVSFTIPNDQVVTDGKLSLAIKVSPALIAQGAHLDLTLNGQSLSHIPLTQANEAAQVYQVNIPAAIVVTHNNLGFSITGNHGTPLPCSIGGDSINGDKAGADKKQWLTILPATEIQFTSQLLNIKLDLVHFPRPFFDPLEMRESQVNFVFAENPKPEALNTAAIISSYLGMKSNYHGIDFPVTLNEIPPDNGIIVAEPGDRIGTLLMPDVEGPTLKLINNPLNPSRQLLLVLGRNQSELRQAAYRLVSQSFPEKTPELAVQPTEIPLSQPYDAPRWIPTDKPVYLSKLVVNNDMLSTNGFYHDALHINFRAAPDLFMWESNHIPLQVNYHFPIDKRFDEDKSQLNVTMNNTFLRNLPVNSSGIVEQLWYKLGGDTRQENYRVQIPPYLIYGDNQLTFYFSMVPKQGVSCDAQAGNNIKSQIDPDSYIDLSDTKHFSELPNLSYYVGASFPFSSLADFSQTLLLLPEKPSVEEIRALLNTTARAGSATGHPINNVNLQLGLQDNADENPELNQKDILVVADLTHDTFYQRLLARSPFALIDGSLSVNTLSALETLKKYLLGDWLNERVDARRYLVSTNDWRGFFSFRSPWNSRRVVVVASATSSRELGKIHTDLQSSKINAGVRGDLTIVSTEGEVRSFRVGSQFTRGELPWYTTLMWYASQHIIILALGTLLVATIIGSSLFILLRRHAAKRLGRDVVVDES